MGDRLIIEAPCPEDMVGLALAAARQGRSALEAALETLPAPVYTADLDGFVTFFNQACIGFTGRTPEIGKDRWCVTWKLYRSDGMPLAHEDCPMAVAIRQGCAIRDVIAVAERPDGTRVMFAPYPTPLLDQAGEIAGAVNILIDVTDERQAGELQYQSQRCRRLAASLTDQRVIDTLLLMAKEYEEKAGSLRGEAPV
jgi:PAS domain S-box-containing protein